MLLCRFFLFFMKNPLLSCPYLVQTRAFGAVGVGLSLDPEGRKRLLVRGSSFALKNRDRSFWTFSFFIFFSLKPHFFDNFFLKLSSISASRRGHLWPSDVTFLGLFGAKINFFMMSTFSLVYARAFGNRQISSLWKILQSLVTPYEELVEDFWGHFRTFTFF